MSRMVSKGWGSALLLAGVACSAATEDSSNGRHEGTAQRHFDIIGGLRAPSPELDHTGGLVYYRRDTGATGLLCSATLIGPQTLVTANHCVAPLSTFARIGIDVSWARGANFREPQEEIPIAGFVPSPIPSGGAFGYGADVAVIHLAWPAAATPAVVRAFSHELLGRSLVTLGFGVSSAANVTDGWRRIGRETVVATRGRIYEAMLGDFESFVEWQLTGDTSEANALAAVELDPALADLPALREEYERWQLLEEYELYAGNAPGDTQSCEGDSGSPLGRIAADGAFETFGVVSGGANSARSVCDNGQVFATF
jgi:Trypsin